MNKLDIMRNLVSRRLENAQAEKAAALDAWGAGDRSEKNYRDRIVAERVAAELWSVILDLRVLAAGHECAHWPDDWTEIKDPARLSVLARFAEAASEHDGKRWAVRIHLMGSILGTGETEDAAWIAAAESVGYRVS